ncbi:hypothetical protein ACFSL4_27420 [Streptomyces caeni]|uniref:SMP-30/Gluconolactonase/LRE-like region domain-containing protein n=1 Tax=Streptomyces caeni TaxID=2307231 RepID=A0ABW4IWN5_9ACTN
MARRAMGLGLPSSRYARMLADQARRRVYVTTGALNATVHELLVYDFDGNLLQTVTADALIDPGAMVLSADGGILYVGVANYILIFNPGTFAPIGGGWVRSDSFKGGAPVTSWRPAARSGSPG